MKAGLNRTFRREVAKMKLEVILLAIGIVLWLVSVNLGSDKAAMARKLQGGAIWIFICTIIYKLYLIIFA